MIVITILKNLATIIYVAAMPYVIFCLWYMFDGEHILVPREKPAGKLNFWPFNAYQFESPREIFRLWQWHEFKDEARYTFSRLPDPRRDFRSFTASLPYAKHDLKSVLKSFWEWAWPFAAGLLVGLVNLVSSNISKALWLAPVNLLVMLAFTALLVAWWFRYGSSLRELLIFSVIMVIVFWVVKTPALITASMCGKGFWASVFNLLPTLVLVGSIGACAINLLYAFAEYYGYSVLKKLSYISSAALSIFLVVLLVCNII